ncbi:MAG: hypothetical protein Q7T25_12825 [Sideroxyarcus sp.]|nr:hypothetical protein [Sideroxyarcus sp.]
MATKSVAAIAERLFAEFSEAIPLGRQPGGDRRRGSKKTVEQDAAAKLNRFYVAARREREQHRLGLVMRARVAFALQKHLLAAGYPAALTKQVLFAMLLSGFIAPRE